MKKIQILLIIIPLISLILFLTYLDSLPRNTGFVWHTGDQIIENNVETTFQLGPVGWAVIGIIVIVPLIIWIRNKK